jgi:hypothetical protein
LGDKSPFELEAGLFGDVPLQRRQGRGRVLAAQGKLAQLRARQAYMSDVIGAEVQDATSALVAAWQRDQTPQVEDDAADYYVTVGRSQHSAYEQNVGNSIRIMRSDGTLQDLSEVPEATAIASLTQRTSRPYICYPKEATALDVEVKKLST